MIDRVKIGDIEYTVKHEREDGCDGSILHGKALIQISDELNIQMERTTLWHEIFHAVFQQTGQKEAQHNEELIEVLSYYVTAIIRHNPALIAYTRGDE